MRIILLSGGSGQRLWPLSNDSRSKQFVKLFKTEDNDYESMLQRVYRQIQAINENTQVTIATGISHVSAIRNQLGEKVSICVEPCRRDTFPAIALASAYLHDVLNVNPEESIIVCPVDPYVDSTYFEAVHHLQALASGNAANISLMGVVPTYPSDKYGYIIPHTIEPVSPVKAFREKPDRKTAEVFLQQGALWNAGIFAFKLGYMLEKAHILTGMRAYQDLFDKYDTLEKTSFDYAVVENEPSIQVMRYHGEWRDVGTWNTMAEVMSDNTKGNVVMDSHCQNTHVVNELDIPVLCMGCKDIVVAVSNDGVLVTDKECSGYMKPYVEQICESAEIRFAEKSWGTYTVIDTQPGAKTVKIVLQSGYHLTYHSHEHRNEVWTVLSGQGKVLKDDVYLDVVAGDTTSAPAGCKHTIYAYTDMVLLEVQFGEEITLRDKKVYPLDHFEMV